MPRAHRQRPTRPLAGRSFARAHWGQEIRLGRSELDAINRSLSGTPTPANFNFKLPTKARHTSLIVRLALSPMQDRFANLGRGRAQATRKARAHVTLPMALFWALTLFRRPLPAAEGHTERRALACSPWARTSPCGVATTRLCDGAPVWKWRGGGRTHLKPGGPTADPPRFPPGGKCLTGGPPCGQMSLSNAMSNVASAARPWPNSHRAVSPSTGRFASVWHRTATSSHGPPTRWVFSNFGAPVGLPTQTPQPPYNLSLPPETLKFVHKALKHREGSIRAGQSLQDAGVGIKLAAGAQTTKSIAEARPSHLPRRQDMLKAHMGRFNRPPTVSWAGRCGKAIGKRV